LDTGGVNFQENFCIRQRVTVFSFKKKKSTTRTEIRIKSKAEKELKGERCLQFNPDKSVALFFLCIYVYTYTHTHICISVFDNIILSDILSENLPAFCLHMV